MQALTPARAAFGGGVAIACAAAVGLVVRVLADGPSPSECAAGAMTVVLAAAIVAAAAVDLRDRDLAGRLRALAVVAAVVWAAGAAAGLAAGGAAGSLGGALVPAAVATLALGLASLLRALRVEPSFAGFAGAAIACVPAALIFVADPWIEWGVATQAAGGGAAARSDVAQRPGRAHLVYRLSPLAAMTSAEGGVGVDWQRMRMLYDGPAQGVPGLSLVGQYYPSTPPRPLPWSGIVLGIGAALVASSRREG